MRKTTRYLTGIGAIVLGAGILASCKELPPTTFATAASWTVGQQPGGLMLADVTGDGTVDAVAGSSDGLVVRAGTGTSFGPEVAHPYSGTLRSLAHGDLDGDGHTDVAAATHGQVTLWEEDGGALASRPALTVAANVVAIDDVTGDGRDDLVVLGWSSDTVSVYAQTAAGTLAPPAAYTVDVGGYNDLEIGDVDGDGDLDVVAMSGQLYATPDLHVLLQQPDGTLSVRGSWSIAGGNISANGVGVGNVDQDATAEVVVSHGGNGASAKVTVFQADATGGLTEDTTIPVLDIPTPVELIDLNGDGHDDAAIGHDGWSTVSVIYGGHSGLVGTVHQYAAGSGAMDPGSLAATDVDADGDVDLGVVTNNGGFTLLRNTGVPTPPPSTTTTTTTATTTSTTATTSTTSSTTTSSTTTTTTVPEPDGPVQDIATGTGVGCAVMTDATAECWGWNAFGQLGDGTTTNRSVPAPVAGLDGVAEISVGYLFTCARLTDGTASCWGDNSYGQLGDGTTTDRPTPAAVPGLDDVTAISAGFRHACAVRASGSVVCWGENEDGQLGDGTTTDRTTPATVVGLDDATAVATGGAHSCAISGPGTVSCWGGDDYGALGNGADPASTTPVAVAGIDDATMISGGNYTVCVARESGTASCWGANNAKQTGDGTSVNRTAPVTVAGLTDVEDVWAGHQHACATVTDGTSYCWGANFAGQLGDGTTTSRAVPTVVPGIAGARVRPTNDHTCAVTADGNAWCWGDGGVGALGNGAEIDTPLPSAVLFDH